MLNPPLRSEEIAPVETDNSPAAPDGELAAFSLSQGVMQLRQRLDAALEAGRQGVMVGLPLARRLLHAMERGATLLWPPEWKRLPEPVQPGDMEVAREALADAANALTKRAEGHPADPRAKGWLTRAAALRRALFALPTEE